MAEKLYVSRCLGCQWRLNRGIPLPLSGWDATGVGRYDGILIVRR